MGIKSLITKLFSLNNRSDSNKSHLITIAKKSHNKDVERLVTNMLDNFYSDSRRKYNHYNKAQFDKLFDYNGPVYKSLIDIKSLNKDELEQYKKLYSKYKSTVDISNEQSTFKKKDSLI